MNELIHIGNADISIKKSTKEKEWSRLRTLTWFTKDRTEQRKEILIRTKHALLRGEDYFIVSADEIRTSRMFPILTRIL